MGKVIVFERGKRPIPGHPPGEGDATILVFTGVRYDRGRGKARRAGAGTHEGLPRSGPASPLDKDGRR